MDAKDRKGKTSESLGLSVPSVANRLGLLPDPLTPIPFLPPGQNIPVRSASEGERLTSARQHSSLALALALRASVQNRELQNPAPHLAVDSRLTSPVRISWGRLFRRDGLRLSSSATFPPTPPNGLFSRYANPCRLTYNR